MGSIMHYGSHYFAKTRDNSDETKTIRVKKKDKLGNCQVGQRSFLSSGDILTINRWYGCPGRFCADLNKNCRKFKKKGYCERDYDKWMKANCPHSCGVCECKDEDEDKCPKAAEKGYCVRGDTGSDSNKKWMAAHCPKSCGRCSHDDKSLCKDQHIWGKADGCQRYKDRLYKGKKMCTSRHFRGKCPKTCNLCPHKAYCW
uniref:Metalloendopeptidase n=1 Tax=Alexandrium andersonii TaxID=327968 RepID=A0A7S2C9Z3_9DINO